MACKYPLKAFRIGTTENGKAELKITPYRAKGVYRYKGSWHVDYDVGRDLPSFERYVKEYEEIPCGKCIECRMQYSRQWADRCMLEAQYHKDNYFITLTYDDAHLHKVTGFNPETGEEMVSPTLRKKDMQDFMKRLRSHFAYHDPEGNKIRFFGCGEYGSSTARPHLHILLFDVPLNDLYVWSKSRLGDYYYRSPTIEKLWPFGNSLIGDVSWNSCAYVARYVVKKAKSDMSRCHEALGQEPEFVLMSRRPGIGRQYFEDHKDELYSTAFTSIATPEGGKKIFRPRYYDKLYEIDSPEIMIRKKQEAKEFAEMQSLLADTLTSQDRFSRLGSEANHIENKLKALKRQKV